MAGKWTEQRKFFEENGYLVVKGFATASECQGMLGRMQELIASWNPQSEKVPIFVTDKKQESAQGASDYFLDSADRIHFFLEAGVTDDDGYLKPTVEKARALNKVGHGLHVRDDVFRTYSQSEKVLRLVNELGWQDPVLPQSMYIFKQPHIGGEVTSHQDSSFLHTTPRETCLGLWLALQPATKQNGCIWARPGSHKELVRRLFVRNPEHFAGDKSKPQMVFVDADTDKSKPAWSWEGAFPPHSLKGNGLRDAGFAPVEMEAGDLLVIHGQVDHLSLPNTSGMPRETFQLHLIEGPKEGVTWADTNWLQYPKGSEFPSLALRARL